MIKKAIVVITVCLLAAIALGAAYLWVQQAEPLQARHELILADASDSQDRDKICTKVLGVGHKILQQPDLGKDSTLTLWFTGGDPERDFQPRSLITLTIPVSRQLLESPETVRVERRELLLQLAVACQQAKKGGRRSPIYHNVQEALWQLQTLVGGPHPRCSLHLISDLRATLHPYFRKSLAAGKIKTEIHPQVLDNTGISVIVYGLAEYMVNPKISKARTGKQAQEAILVRQLFTSVLTEPPEYIPISPRHEL